MAAVPVNAGSVEDAFRDIQVVAWLLHQVV
jgi:hypothetical protein